MLRFPARYNNLGRKGQVLLHSCERAVINLIESHTGHVPVVSVCKIEMIKYNRKICHRGTPPIIV